MTKKPLFEQVPTIRAGDRILRRRRKPRGLFTTLSRGLRRVIRSSAGR